MIRPLMEATVRESKSYTANEAVDLKLVDFIADDLGSVLKQVNGRQVIARPMDSRLL